MILKTYIDTTHQKGFEFGNISGKVENYNGSNVVRFNQEKQNHQLFLLERIKINIKGLEGQNVFVVKN